MNLDGGQRGALVINVTEGSPADEAGLRGSARQVTIQGRPARVGGDVITQVNDQPVQSFADLSAYLFRNTQVGDEVELTVLRDGQEETLTITLEARPDEPAPQPETDRADTPAWLGIRGIGLVPAIAERMDFAADQSGVLVVEVEAGSPADEAGLRGSFRQATINGERILIGGDIITAINGEPVERVQALVEVLRQANPGDTVTLTLLRDEGEIQQDVTLAERPQ
jgi:2-alkenal reductase